MKEWLKECTGFNLFWRWFSSNSEKQTHSYCSCLPLIMGVSSDEVCSQGARRPTLKVTPHLDSGGGASSFRPRELSRAHLHSWRARLDSPRSCGGESLHWQPPVWLLTSSLLCPLVSLVLSSLASKIKLVFSALCFCLLCVWEWERKSTTKKKGWQFKSHPLVLRCCVLGQDT